MKPSVAVLEDIHSDGIERIAQFADLQVLTGLDRQGQLKAVGAFDAIVVRSVIQVDLEMLEAAARLKVVGRAGTGVENIDVELAISRGVRVLTVPTGNTISAAEFTVALMLNESRRLPEAKTAVERGDFRRHLLQGRELASQRVGLVGLGNVGMAVAERLAAFGCKLFGLDPEPRDVDRFTQLGGIVCPSFTNMLSQVDILSFHVPLTPESRSLFNIGSLGFVQPGLMVINTSRGGVIDDDALLKGLDENIISCAALDVIDPEPPFDLAPGEHTFAHSLLSHQRVTITPHMAASTEEAQQRIATDLADKLEQSLT
jgi:D-3-phosphoglycerate dehydrogenase / 2-oxoglutarate reductase